MGQIISTYQWSNESDNEAKLQLTERCFWKFSDREDKQTVGREEVLYEDDLIQAGKEFGLEGKELLDIVKDSQKRKGVE